LEIWLTLAKKLIFQESSLQIEDSNQGLPFLEQIIFFKKEADVVSHSPSPHIQAYGGGQAGSTASRPSRINFSNVSRLTNTRLPILVTGNRR